jgi:hypothetical protein
VQKQGGEVVDLAQKTFCEFTIADHESHFQGSRASLVCDLPLATFSKEIARKTRMHTRGLSPTNTQKTRGLSLQKTRGLSLGFLRIALQIGQSYESLRGHLRFADVS